ncbi:MATE family efflux transporter [Paraglaciecola aquimarina]|uniref:MATE family efflux transporter n=1 Tax=Paraglaciecola aquimarina TaxID=1235557 RepID=A0ABU3STC2_9ALTE|nr:MATE family efflux transporter [Paraglaciecola aquimarina]MDU0353250.1 MATE family efflux transporter [Paraglaciecola aquimarina]
MSQNRILSNFFQISLHQKILLIAGPMILSNITTPLMGLVDTAVLGHMDGTHYLAGASIATLIITQVYWVCGFLRMTSTGLSAQAKGNSETSLGSKSLFQGLLVGLLLAVLLLAFQQKILQLGLYLANTSAEIETSLTAYFNVRIWGAPAAIANLALVGWLIGQQKAKSVLLIQVSANLLNVVLNFWFVLGLELDVFGVALATVLAEYFIFIVSLLMAIKALINPTFDKQWFSLGSLKPVLSLNGNTFLRNLMLQACIAFLIFKGVGYGSNEAAINAIIMQFFTLIALGLDGVAFAAEALVGEKKGQGSQVGIVQVTLHGLVWSTILALVYSVAFGLLGAEITALLTDQISLRQQMEDYMLFVVLLPLIAHWCFFFDGIFVGLTRAIAMRNSMVVSAVIIYFPTFWLLSAYQNQGLWIAMLCFMCSRGITLGAILLIFVKRRRWPFEACGHAISQNT